jgi:hypothetical protein
MRFLFILLILPLLPGATTASFLKTDVATKGSWKGVYGSDGFNIINDTSNYPSYVTVTPSGNASNIWGLSATDVRDLERGSTTERIAACWFSSSSFTVDLNFKDTNSHQVALYLLDWDNYGRTERVDILDANNTLLDSRSVSNFQTGQYLVWNLSGHVIVKITNTSSNAVLSGLFFDAGPTPVPTPVGPLAIKVLPPLVFDPITGTISCPQCVVADTSGNVTLAGSLLTGFGSTKAGQFGMKDKQGNFWYFCPSATGAWPAQGSAVPCAP